MAPQSQDATKISSSTETDGGELTSQPAGCPSVQVAVVSATFKQGRSYQENLWAESLADLGFFVTVYAPSEEKTSRTTESLSPGGMSYQVISIPSHILPRNQVLTDALGDALSENLPHLIVWFGGIMFFGREVYTDPRLSKIPVITIYSLSRRGRQPFKWLGADLTLQDRVKGLAFQLLRAPVLTQSLKRAQLTIANTPECTDIIRQYVWGAERLEWARKHEEIPLGFCPYTFTFRSMLREQARQALPINMGECVVLFSTRFEEDKWPAIEQCFDTFERCVVSCQKEGHPLPHMVWVGLDHSDVSERLKNRVTTSKYKIRHHLIQFQSRQRLATWYHIADVALFPQPSISVQEAMGTGITVLCPPDPSLDHLKAYSSRIYLEPEEYWVDRLYELCRELPAPQSDLEKRELAAHQARPLSYIRLVKRSLKALHARLDLSQHEELVTYKWSGGTNVK